MQQIEPKVSVVVLNYNGANYVRGCLESLFKNDYGNFEVIFVDNNSPDKSVEIAKKLFKNERRLKIIENKENYGFSIGNNIGFKASDAKYVLSLNNDTKVQENFIRTMVNVAEADEKVGSVGCKIVQLDGVISYGPKYMNYGFITSALNRQSYEKETCNIANCGCATLFRKSLLDKIGGFDPYLWTDWEDHDLGYRINIAGYKCLYTPKTTVLHLGGGNYLGMSPERRSRIIRNKLLGHYKNYETKNLFARFPLVTLKTLTWDSLPLLKEGKISAVIKAVAGFYVLLEPISKERAKIQKQRVVSDKEIFKKCRVPERQSFLFKTLKKL